MNASCWYYQKQLNSQILPVSLLNPWALKKKVLWMPLRKRQKAAGTKELQEHVHNEKWEHINNEFASMLLRGNCLHHGLVLEKCIKIPKKDREQAKNELMYPWDRHTVPRSVRLQGRSAAWHLQSVIICMSQISSSKVFMAVYVFPEFMIFLLLLHCRDGLLPLTPKLESSCKCSLWYSHGFIIYASFL